jgi:hypothetical protein
LYRNNEGIATALVQDIRERDLDVATVAKLTERLGSLHSGANDCQAIAEAETAGLGHFLTCDRELLKHLSGYGAIRVLKPSAYWEWLTIPRGAPPFLMPHQTNHLACKDWREWRVEPSGPRLEDGRVATGPALVRTEPG